MWIWTDLDLEFSVDYDLRYSNLPYRCLFRVTNARSNQVPPEHQDNVVISSTDKFLMISLLSTWLFTASDRGHGISKYRVILSKKLRNDHLFIVNVRLRYLICDKFLARRRKALVMCIGSKVDIYSLTSLTYISLMTMNFLHWCIL